MNNFDWTDEIFLAIERMGATGKTPPMIAMELNMTPSQLKDYRSKNIQLDNVLNRAEYDARQFMIARMEADCINGKNTAISREVYTRLTEKDKNKGDNRIIIEEV